MQSLGRAYPRTEAQGRRLLVVGAVSMLAGGWLFFAIAEDVVTADSLIQLDQRLANFLHANATPLLTSFFLQVSLMHGVAAISAYTAALAGFLLLQGDGYWARRVLLVVAGGMLLNTALKYAYQRIRPTFDDPHLTLTTYSFPSGHTAGTTLFYGIFAIVLISRLESFALRALCLGAAALMVALVAFSRMYLGVHFLSDVIAAGCASLAWLAFMLIASARFEKARQS